MSEEAREGIEILQHHFGGVDDGRKEGDKQTNGSKRQHFPNVEPTADRKRWREGKEKGLADRGIKWCGGGSLSRALAPRPG